MYILFNYNNKTFQGSFRSIAITIRSLHIVLSCPISYRTQQFYIFPYSVQPYLHHLIRPLGHLVSGLNLITYLSDPFDLNICPTQFGPVFYFEILIVQPNLFQFPQQFLSIYFRIIFNIHWPLQYKMSMPICIYLSAHVIFYAVYDQSNIYQIIQIFSQFTYSVLNLYIS